MTMSALKHYRLDENKRPVQCSFEQWGDMFEDIHNRRVARTILEDGRRVSTVFIGIDHRLDDNGPPLLFETMVFDTFDKEAEGEETHRYSSWDDAEAGHNATVKQLRATWKAKKENT